jgi:phosphoribosylaminoimidazole-succinocarboxamide synthase
MSDSEKFEGFKNKMLEENEEKYGKEIREKYGEDEVKKSNQKFKNMTKEQYDEVQRLSLEVNETLKQAFEQGDPTSEFGLHILKRHIKV